MAFLGIDLGTTNSLSCLWQDGQSIVIPNATGELMTPSVVSFDPDTNEVIIGQAAKNRLVSHPDLTISSFKRYMGTKKIIQLGTQSFYPEELSALLLKQLKTDAELYIGHALEEAIISVPAYFNDTQRAATKVAGEMAGLRVERLINEPTAAALAYGLNEQANEQTFMVIDLGGGTLDVSILDIFDNVIEVRASAGDNFFGGEDFTTRLKQLFLDQNAMNANALSGSELSQLQGKIEKLKHTLATQQEAVLDIHLQNKPVRWCCTRDQFEQSIASLIARFVQPIERALNDSDVALDELDNVILVGGATRMPWVRSEVSKLFRRIPFSEIDPDKVVVKGTAVQAALKERDKTFKDIVLTDVCPYTLGVEIAVLRNNQQYESGHFLPVIERNMTVPLSREKRLFSLYDDQDTIVCQIFQGESRLTQNNVNLGKIEASVPKAKAGQEFVDIRFTYDVNGILEVTLKINGTGEVKTLLINNASNNLSADEVKKRMKALDSIKILPREQAANKLIISRIDRLYEEHLGETREYLAEILSQFEQVLNTQDETLVAEARVKINHIIDNIEQKG